ncbi:hypothetical protein PILCRDRAFT_830370 [Piloderma croceum F 1598]|uniref:Uncharacterized protein n=1 Tax=Piloderma croceum (strain F 1598) TaxID=765440 RepID=A0A0C3B2B8_PILCF|nr:hypothetical protein PILCRDRAFT_830370 [Piloderma croceum F 1598]
MREIIKSNAELDYLPARTSRFSAFLSDPRHEMRNSLPHANTTISDTTSYVEGTIPSNNQDLVIT